MAEDVPMEENSENETFINEIINNLIHNDEIYFKSQQLGEKDLTLQEKRDIAKDIFTRSKANFLCRFGKYLKEDQLNFFQKCSSSDESYEINYHIQELRRYFSENKRNIDVKNRRFCALNKMVDGSYFSETEMMRRNPLLYDQLVGQYLTEEEKKLRDNIDTENITFVNLLLESIDRKACREKQKEQEKYEDSVMEEEEEEDSSDEENVDKNDKIDENVDKTTKWGEYSDYEPSTSDNYERYEPKKPIPIITATERRIFKEEFFSIMYQNFIDGKDKDFDYSSVDNNEEYDNIDLKNYDAEEKYFDSESPEEITNENKMEEDVKDDLDVFMERLNEHHTIKELTKKINHL